MVLVSFLLVLAAAVTLVIGLLNSGLGLIYVSIGCSVAAGIVLALAVLRSRPERAAAPGAGSERLRALEEEEAPSVTVVPTRGRKGRAAVVEEPADVELEEAADGEGVFPIADYDDLKVGEIVSLLPELDQDELEMVRDREESGKNRSTILTRVEALSGAAVAAGAGRGGDWDVSERHWDSWEDDSDEGEEVEAEVEEERVGDDELFPIAEYDDLKAAEVVSLLPELDDDELEEVRDRELRGAARATVLNRIDQLLGNEPPPPPKKAPAKKTAAKKTTAKKAPAKKAAAKKTTAKKAAAKKTTTAKKTTAKKTVAKKR